MTTIAVAVAWLGCLILLREALTVPRAAASEPRSWKPTRPPDAGPPRMIVVQNSSLAPTPTVEDRLEQHRVS